MPNPTTNIKAQNIKAGDHIAYNEGEAMVTWTNTVKYADKIVTYIKLSVGELETEARMAVSPRSTLCKIDC